MSPRLWSLLAGALLVIAPACHPGRAQEPAPEDGPALAPRPAKPSYRKVWGVSPKGSDAAKGTEQAPFRTIGRALKAAEPGDLVTVKSGTYAERVELGAGVRDGTAAAKITLRGEGRPRIVPGGAWALVNVHRPHWIVEGFDLDAEGGDHAGAAFTGNTEGSVLRDCELHDGTAGAAVLIAAGASGVTLEGNHIHDYARGGKQDAHGVEVSPGTRNVILRANRIHDVSGDAVQCSGPEGVSREPPAADLLIEGNELWHTGENAVDLKTCHRVTVRENRMHDFTDALPGGCLVVVHMSARDVVIEDNELSHGGKGIAVGGNHEGPVPTNIVIRRNRIRSMVQGDGREGVGIRLENSENAQVLDNTFSDLQGVALRVGYGTGGPTRGARVEGNALKVERAYDLGLEAPGLSSRRNVYLPRASFVVGKDRDTVDLSGWQKLGFDPDAVVETAP
jgi:nitrous oxidase accessory protein NosD